MPFADASFDFVYSLGVLHHIEDTQCALAGLVRKLKIGGRLRIYLYWKRAGWQGALLAAVGQFRRFTTRMPHIVVRAACLILSLVLYAVLIIPYRLLSTLGARFHQEWPLFVYTKYPFNVLYNDQFDRFSAPLEKRYSPEEVAEMLNSAGLRNVRVLKCYGWIGEGIKAE
jgi:SAM-dependent methyltransferase